VPVIFDNLCFDTNVERRFEKIVEITMPAIRWDRMQCQFETSFDLRQRQDYFDHLLFFRSRAQRAEDYISPLRGRRT